MQCGPVVSAWLKIAFQKVWNFSVSAKSACRQWLSRERAKFIIWQGRWKGKFLQRNLLAPYEIIAKKAHRTVFLLIKDVSAPYSWKTGAAKYHQWIITKPFLSLRVFVDRNLTLRMKNYDWWIVFANNWQRKLHHIIHHPAKHFSSCKIHSFDLKMNNLAFQISFWVY